MRALLPIVLSLFLPGCATLSESQCGQGDWFGVGESDALSGYTADRIHLHAEACGKYGIAPDPRGYDAGYAQGLETFCQPPAAFALGRRGAAYHGQCPRASDPIFLPAFDLGREVHAIEQELIRIEGEIGHLRDAVKDEDGTPASREAAERQLHHVKDERDRRRHARDDLLARARARGYGNVW
jgi:hypothetical protein